MKRVTLVELLVHDQDEALEFYTTKRGFELAEDSKLGDYRWLLVRSPSRPAELSFMCVERLHDGRIRVAKPRARPQPGQWKPPLADPPDPGIARAKAAGGERRSRGPDRDETGRATRPGTDANADAEAVEPRRARRAVEF